MTGRKGLTLVTALTVASLLLGGGALNALAEGHVGGAHGGGGQAKPDHQHPEKPAVVNQAKHNGGSNAVQPATAKHDDQQDRQDNDDNNKNVKRGDDDNEDLVTPPARVTKEDRPGLGCGDDNHTHTGAPGNPDKTCKPRGDAGDDAEDMTSDGATDAATVTGVNEQASAAVDDSDGN